MCIIYIYIYILKGFALCRRPPQSQGWALGDCNFGSCCCWVGVWRAPWDHRNCENWLEGLIVKDLGTHMGHIGGFGMLLEWFWGSLGANLGA